MSAKTRIHRPTTATPRKVEVERPYLHQSTFLVQEVEKGTGRRKLVKQAPPVTYRRPS